MVEVPVPEARYEAIVALKNKLLLLSRPVQGSLDRNWLDGSPPRERPPGVLRPRRGPAGDLAHRGGRHGHQWGPEPTGLHHVRARGEDGRRLRVVASSTKPDEEHAKEPPGRRSGFVDLGRVRVLVDPGGRVGRRC